MKFNYVLKNYSIAKALNWGNCRDHWRKGRINGHKVHRLIAVIEALPIIGQIASLFELAIVRLFGDKNIVPPQVPVLPVPPPAQNTFSAGNAPIEKLMHRNVRDDVLNPKLPLSVLGRLSQASKTLHEQYQPIVDQGWQAAKAAMTIGPAQWAAIGVNIKNVPPLPKDIDARLKEPCPFHPGRRVHQTHRLVLMHEDLSINDQGQRTRHLRDGNEPNIFRFIWDKITGQKGDKKVGKPYWALITSEVIPGSLGINFAQQKTLLDRYPEYKLPTVLEAITLVTMNRQCFGEYLLPENPLTGTRCFESIDGVPLFVGAFGPSGLRVRRSAGGSYNFVGVLAVKRL